jgi:Aminoglycoside-2''-adenylyltransferase
MRHDPAVDRWEPLSVQAVAELMHGCTARWWLSGGWAVDHWLGRATREHGDIDVSTLGPALPAVLRHLPGHLHAFAAVDGRLSPFASRADDPEVHNLWIQDGRTGRWVLQVNIEAGDQTAWRYRRAPRIALPWASAVQHIGGVPTGSAATQLLWKSARPRPQDDADLAAALGALPRTERRWLDEAITTAHPASPWAGRSDAAGQPGGQSS